MRNSGEPIFLLDCRESDEYELVRIASATLLPMSEIANRIGEIDDRHNTEIVVYCHHGVRSLRVADWLRNRGFAHVKSLAGGIDQWASEIEPALSRY